MKVKQYINCTTSNKLIGEFDLIKIYDISEGNNKNLYQKNTLRCELSKDGVISDNCWINKDIFISDLLNQSTINNNTLILPNIILFRELFLEVKKLMINIGGKWNTKAKGFIFTFDPTERINQISSGEKINLKKDFQFFETPKHLASKMAKCLQAEYKDDILEPSGGRGMLINTVSELLPDIIIETCELMPENRLKLKSNENATLVGKDFLSLTEHKYDKIIANPPFTKNQDIKHVYHMYELLRDNGRIVTLTSTHWMNSNNKLETEFREWLNEINADIEIIPKNTFKESGTLVETVLIIIDK